MGMTTAEFLCERRLAWDVDTIHGFTTAASGPGAIQLNRHYDAKPDHQPVVAIVAPEDGLPGAVEAARQFAKEFKPGQ